MAELTPLKEHLGPAAIQQLAELLKAVYPAFRQQDFEARATAQLEQLELKARVSHVISALADTLPAGFCDTARILNHVAERWPAAAQDRNWSSYAAWPLIDFVGVYGLDYPQRAFELFEKLTPLFTAEFAIRPFLLKHFDLTYQQMLRWTEHDHEHVRRLASEGIRPRLPWAQQLPALRQDPSLLFPLLDKLKTDPSLYVRRSVANNLNDISKDHPQMVLEICREWQKLANKDTDWLIRHGLRTLVKTGHPEVYPLLGFSETLDIRQSCLALTTTAIKLGDSLEWTLSLQTAAPKKLVLDYRIGFLRADGRQSWKVFKWKNIETQAHTPLTLHKSQCFKPLSTRRYYPGTHRIECLLNGQVVARETFELSV